jgi:two-component system sensor kinase FixL
MSWITIAWSMNAGACFVLAAVYFVVWCNQRDSWPHLLFACSAVAAAVMALIELAMLHSTTVDEYAALIRWIHVPVWLLTLSFVAFVRLYLHAGRAWLAWSIYGLRTLVLIINFISAPNINFRAITGIRHFSWWGETDSVVCGLPNPRGLRTNVSLM